MNAPLLAEATRVGSLRARGGNAVPTTPIDTRDEILDNSLVTFEHGQNIVGKRTAGRSAPTTVNSSVRTREYLTTAEIDGGSGSESVCNNASVA